MICGNCGSKFKRKKW
ncbi:hypothetical protein RSJ13_10470 [Clostridium botulinum]|nr:hypothetical protein RSJ13_10470 [Clostridium botulinum]